MADRVSSAIELHTVSDHLIDQYRIGFIVVIRLMATLDKSRVRRAIDGC